MFTNAIIRRPASTLSYGLTSAALGSPDLTRVNEQHGNYEQALKSCGLDVQVLEADDQYPDSVFVEDPAIVTKQFALITRPRHPSRTGETERIRDALQENFSEIEEIVAPGTLEGGDVMMAGNHFFIGLSHRTNCEGANQAISILKTYGMSGSVISQHELLHLKTGISYLENNIMIAVSELAGHPQFKSYDIIHVSDDERYAANCVWINGSVLIPNGYPQTLQKVRDRGYDTISLEMSEFRKMDGGLSCLSLRY